MINRIKGSFLGALGGDCIGSIYEEAGCSEGLFFDEETAKKYSSDVIELIKTFPTSLEVPLKYTDDTAMACCVSKSLIDRGSFDSVHMIKLLCDTYFEDPNRGYGDSIPKLFRQLRDDNYSDICGAAKNQFHGLGSHWNGCAIRVFPVALFYCNDLPSVIQTAKNQCLLTHAHPDAVMGAILQATAVYLALNADEKTFDLQDFVTRLSDVVELHHIESYGRDGTNPYRESLKLYQTLIANKSSTFVVASKLGNGFEASRSVPSAIFAFLKSTQSEANDFSLLPNGLLRTVAYALSLGGDTDSITSMAGAIAGAFYGDKCVPESWTVSLEGYQEYERFAAAIYKRID